MPGEDSVYELVGECCARAVGATTGVDRGRLTDGEWRRLPDLAARHRVLPHVAAHLGGLEGASVPDDIADDLDRRRRKLARRNLALADALAEVLDALEDAGIRALAHKGPVAATRLYGDLGRRQFLDLDVLVEPAAFGRAGEILETVDFQPKKHLEGLDQVLYADRDDVIVDLHARLTPRYFPGRLDFDGLWARREAVALGDREVPALALDDLFVALAVHGTKHRWHRLAWVTDVAVALGTSSLDWQRVARGTRAVHAGRMARLAGRLAAEELGVDEPSPLAGLGREGPALDRLVELSQKALRAPAPRGGEIPVRYHLRALERRRDRARYLLEHGTRPAAADRALVDLPAPLAPLYRLVRPSRLMGAYLAERLGGRRS